VITIIEFPSSLVEIEAALGHTIELVVKNRKVLCRDTDARVELAGEKKITRMCRVVVFAVSSCCGSGQGGTRRGGREGGTTDTWD